MDLNDKLDKIKLEKVNGGEGPNGLYTDEEVVDRIYSGWKKIDESYKAGNKLTVSQLMEFVDGWDLINYTGINNCKHVPNAKTLYDKYYNQFEYLYHLDDKDIIDPTKKQWGSR